MMKFNTVTAFTLLLTFGLLVSTSGLYAQQNQDFNEDSYELMLKAEGFLPELPGYVPEAVFLYPDFEQIRQMLKKQPKTAITNLPEPIHGQNWTLVLNRVYNASSFELNGVDGDKRVTPQEYRHGLHYHGYVQGLEGSMVAISLFENEVYGLIVTDHGHFDLGVYGERTSDLYILYNSDMVNQLLPFECGVDDNEAFHNMPDERDAMAAELLSGCNFVTIYYECDFHMYNQFGSSTQNVANHVSALHNQVSMLYNVWNINLIISNINVWTETDPYISFTSSHQMLAAFGSEIMPNTAALGHLLSTRPAGMGGVAYLGVLCSPSMGNAFSNISTSFNNVPTYSWSVNVVAHELGHNFGSRHTHNCSWNNLNTAIDGCGPQAGYNEGCVGPIPSGGGTVMSYCHLISGVGINFVEGFGEQPGQLLQQRVLQAYTNPYCNITSGLNVMDTLSTTVCGFLELDGTFYGSSGQYIHVANPGEGCDELLILDLEVTPVNYIFDTICAGEAFIYEDLSFNETGIYFLEAPDSLSCQGLALQLTVVDLMPELEMFDEDVLATLAVPGATYTWVDCENGTDLTAFSSDNLFLIPGPGTYQVLVELPGCLAASECIEVVGTSATSFGTDFSVKLAPNPNNGSFSIYWQLDQSLQANLRIYNIAGALMYQQQDVSLNAGQGSLDLEHLNLPSGSYVLQMITSEEFSAMPFVVIK